MVVAVSACPRSGRASSVEAGLRQVPKLIYITSGSRLPAQISNHSRGFRVVRPRSGERLSRKAPRGKRRPEAGLS